MNRAFALLLAVLAAAATAQTPSGDTLLVSLDYRGDRLVRLSDEPTLSIYADGRLFMPQLYEHVSEFTDQLDQAGLAQLLDFIQTNGFFEYGLTLPSTAGSGGPELRFAHTTETILYVNDGVRSRRVAVMDLEHQTGAERLRAIRDRLEQLMSIAKLGGWTEATHWLDWANEELASAHPDAAPLSLDDLKSGAVRADGSVTVQFARAATDPADAVRVTISVDADGASAAAVYPRAQ